jgi:hypothetical protein
MHHLTRVVLLLLHAVPLAAQQPEAPRRWASLTAGAGPMSHCREMAACGFAETGTALTLSASRGTHRGAGLLTGGEASVWAVRGVPGGGRATLVTLGPLVGYRPHAGLPLHLKGSAGLSTLTLSDHLGDIQMTELRPGAYAGVGMAYDLPLRTGFALTPAVDYRYSGHAHTELDRRAHLLHLTVGLSFGR